LTAILDNCIRHVAAALKCSRGPAVARTPHWRHTVNSEFSFVAVHNMPKVEIAYIHTGTRAGVAGAMVGLPVEEPSTASITDITVD
jgi:hypothetical protein